MVNLAFEAVECVAAFRSYARGLGKCLWTLYIELEVFWTSILAETRSLLRKHLNGKVSFCLSFLLAVPLWMCDYCYSTANHACVAHPSLTAAWD